jgi:LmbE family N-acetylglucosaminyl deacetylase
VHVMNREQRVVIVSPHCDDAAFSLGGSLTSGFLGQAPLIVNVFSVSNYTVQEPGYADIETTTAIRKNEELTVASRLGARVLFLDFKEPLVRGPYSSLDALFDTKTDPSADPVYREVAASIQKLCLHHGSALWLFPLGIGGHIDHRILHNIGCDLLLSGVLAQCGFYPDLPYATNESHASFLRPLSENSGCAMEKVCLEANVLQQKLTLLSTYGSQMRSEDIDAVTMYHSVMPDEMFWLYTLNCKIISGATP